MTVNKDIKTVCIQENIIGSETDVCLFAAHMSKSNDEVTAIVFEFLYFCSGALVKFLFFKKFKAFNISFGCGIDGVRCSKSYYADGVFAFFDNGGCDGEGKSCCCHYDIA